MSEPATAPSPADYRQLLFDHVVSAWFPRSIDRRYGGFLCDFDRRWANDGKNDKLLEFQARQTLFAAEVMMCFPMAPGIGDAVSAGFEFLRDAMWDREYGGWYWLVDREGKPVEPETKHLHGMAYAVEACHAVFAATGDPQARELGRQGFLWLDTNAHDERHGGYFELLETDGSVVTAGPGSQARDHIGTPVGQKDMNVHSDLFEAFTYVCMRVKDPLVRLRLDELANIIVDRYAAPQRSPWFFFDADWTPDSTHVRTATALQTAGRLLEARQLYAAPGPLEDAARSLASYCLRHGRNPVTGLFVFGRHGDQDMTAAELADASWWIQFEALRTLTYCDAIGCPLAEPQAWIDIWARISDQFVDREHRGVFYYPRDGLGLVDRLVPTKRRRRTLRKGDMWKDASHEGRVLLRLLAMPQANPGSLPVAENAASWDLPGRCVL